MHRGLPNRLFEALDDGQQMFTEVSIAAVRFTIQDVPAAPMEVELFQTGMDFMPCAHKAFRDRLLCPQ